jgi:maltose alpha-D-glucosyltransferase/alpha-amylase
VHEPGFLKSLLSAIARGRRYKDAGAELLAHPSRTFRKLVESTENPLEPLLIKRDQSNTSVAYGDRLMFKLFRRIIEGTNPDVEIGRFLTDLEFAHVPPLAGHMELRKGRGEPATIGILQGLVANEGDAWRYTQDSLGYYFEEVLTRDVDVGGASLPNRSPVELARNETPEMAKELIGTYLGSACLLGQRTGEMHVALASDSKNPAFAPEPFTALYRRSLYQSMRSLADQSLGLLQKRLKRLPEETQRQAAELLTLEAEIFNRCRQLVERKIGGMRIRCHGDYHLGQVLYTGKDFVIIDFEGEPARSITERRLKRSPLRDVAGMLRSFNYAVLTKLRGGALRPEDAVQLKPWGRYWEFWISVSYLSGYFDVTRQSGLLPKTREELDLLMNILLLDKAIYELRYELDNRPDWVAVPIEGILELIKTKAAVSGQ